eukprot:2358474-Rhodomonas_salina.7
MIRQISTRRFVVPGGTQYHMLEQYQSSTLGQYRTGGSVCIGDRAPGCTRSPYAPTLSVGPRAPSRCGLVSTKAFSTAWYKKHTLTSTEHRTRMGSTIGGLTVLVQIEVLARSGTAIPRDQYGQNEIKGIQAQSPYTLY